MEHVSPNTRLGLILTFCETLKVSDLHVQPFKPLRVRLNGELRKLHTDDFPILSDTEVQQMIHECFSEQVRQKIFARNEFGVSFFHKSIRYRANFSRQQGSYSASFRLIRQQRDSLRDLRLPVGLTDILKAPRGMVLITGPTGQGKSTTARALLQEVNHTMASRIVTIEDPIEYIFEDIHSQFEQREVGTDTDTFASGIRNAMRQDANIIFIGEMLDTDSIWAALTAAETGHMVVATMHGDSTARVIGRVRDIFPSKDQEAISQLLARNLTAVITQRLLPSVDERLVPCLEIMRRDLQIQDAIQKNELQLLQAVIEASVSTGMHSFDQYLIELVASEMVTQETALIYAINQHRVEMLMHGYKVQETILKPQWN